METNNSFDEIRMILQEIADQQRSNEREISRVAKIVGDIGNKFGSFTEGMAFPSMDKVLRKQFGTKTVTTNYKTEAGSDTLEIDVLGLANGGVNTAVIVEVKSRLKRRDTEQTLKTIERFRRLHPEHASKKLYGIIACVSGSGEQPDEAQQAGLFVASIHSPRLFAGARCHGVVRPACSGLPRAQNLFPPNSRNFTRLQPNLCYEYPLPRRGCRHCDPFQRRSFD